MKKKSIAKYFIFSIACIIIGIILAGYISYQYIDDSEKANLPSVEATITDMTSHETAGRHTLYIISYKYYIDGTEYSGKFNSYSPILIGNNIEIKYNPEAPEISTATTKPDTKGFIFVLIFSSVLIIFGSIFSVVIWKNRQILSYTTEDKPYYHEPNEKRNPKSYLLFLLPISMFLIALVLMHFQPFAQKSVSTIEFAQIMQSEGYEAENSRERLQVEFGMGSIIEDAYSVNTDNIRLDFCKLNTSRNTYLLFSSASLPSSNYTIDKKNLVASEDDSFFYIKAFRNNTFVYGGCTIENKDRLIQIFKDLGYYNE